LVVVLGHSSCGAVRATLSELQQPDENRSPNLHDIVSRIQPAVEPLLSTELKNNPQRLLDEAVRANVCASIQHLRHDSPIIEKLLEEQSLMIVSAEYSLETGKVEFFDCA
jgi:carbonic anhydrase